MGNLFDLAGKPYEIIYNASENFDSKLYKLWVFFVFMVLFFPIAIIWFIPLLITGSIQNIIRGDL